MGDLGREGGQTSGVCAELQELVGRLSKRKLGVRESSGTSSTRNKWTFFLRLILDSEVPPILDFPFLS